MKDNEMIWIVCVIVFLAMGVLGIWYWGIKSLAFTHIFITLSFIFIYGTAELEYTKHLEKKLPKKGKECYGYVYDKKQGDNDSVIYHVAVYLEEQNINKPLKYQSFFNTKLKRGEIVKGYYYKDKVVLDKKGTNVKSLPQNVIDTFEIDDEKMA